jgi:hypothetical protein
MHAKEVESEARAETLRSVENSMRVCRGEGSKGREAIRRASLHARRSLGGCAASTRSSGHGTPLRAWMLLRSRSSIGYRAWMRRGELKLALTMGAYRLLCVYG